MQKKFRLRKNYQFQYVYKHGKAVSDANCTVVFCKSSAKTPKIGISVSKKLGKAVQRNRAKRRIREVVNRLIERMDKARNYIFLPKSPVLTQPYAKLEEEIKALLERAGLYS